MFDMVDRFDRSADRPGPLLVTLRRLALTGCVSCSLVAVRAATAQIDTTGRTHVSVTPYAWLSGITGDVGVRDVAVHVDVPFADVLKVLKFAAMGTLEARHGPWLGSVDILYVSLGARRSMAIRGDTGSLELKQHETILQPMGGYTIGNAQWALDLLAGLRYWNLGVTLDTDRPRAANERSGSRGWVDALGGARFRIVPASRVRVVLGADAGGGGSKGTWQAYTSVGVDVSSTVAVGVAYRYLDVNYDRDNVLFDTHTHGPAIGAIVRF
jgi:hypothetical protein